MSDGKSAGGIFAAIGAGLLAIIGVVARSGDDLFRAGGKAVGGLSGSADDLARGGGRAFSHSGDDLARGGSHLPHNFSPSSPRIMPVPVPAIDDVASGARSMAKSEAEAAAQLGDIGFQASKTSALASSADSLASFAPGPSISKLLQGERVTPTMVNSIIGGLHHDTVNVLKNARPFLNREAASRAKQYLAQNRLPQRAWLGRGFKGVTRERAVNTALELAAKYGDDWPKHLLEELVGYAPDLALELVVSDDDEEVLSPEEGLQFRQQMGLLLQDAENYRQQQLPAAREAVRQLSSGSIINSTVQGASEAQLFDITAEGLLYRLRLARAAEDVETHAAALR